LNDGEKKGGGQKPDLHESPPKGEGQRNPLKRQSGGDAAKRGKVRSRWGVARSPWVDGRRLVGKIYVKTKYTRWKRGVQSTDKQGRKTGAIGTFGFEREKRESWGLLQKQRKMAEHSRDCKMGEKKKKDVQNCGGWWKRGEKKGG